jgi:hypothetical protein
MVHGSNHRATIGTTAKESGRLRPGVRKRVADTCGSVDTISHNVVYPTVWYS